MSPASRLDRAPFRVGDVLVEPARLRIVRDGEIIPLEPRWMGLLVHFADHAGEPVSTDALLREVWKTESYGDNVLRKAIHGLRRALGDDARDPRYIRSLNRNGYMLIAPVTRVGDYRDPHGPAPAPTWSQRNPFLGLQAFDDSHEDVFCGRRRFIERTLAAIHGQLDNGQRFVFLQGASGCGKTSLLRAGVIPALRKSGDRFNSHVLAVATCDLAGVQDGEAATALVAALMTWKLDERSVFAPQVESDAVARLVAHPAAIGETIEDALRRRTQRREEKKVRPLLLLMVDHAEVLVSSDAVTPAQRERVSTLLRGVRESPNALILMNCRSDFAPRLSEAMPELADWKAGQGYVEVTRPNAHEIAEIIRQPALKAGLTYEQDPDTLSRLDDVLRDAAMREPDVLPLLQHTLQALYERDHARHVLSFAAYREIGGLEGALARHAEAVFATLPPAAQARLDDVLSRLVVTQPDSDSISGQRAHWSTLADPDARQLVHEFIRARLFVGELNDGLPGFGVAHEALLRQWPRASEWAHNNQKLLKAQEHLKRAAKRWDDEGRLDDHLLNPGQQLHEARDVERRFPDGVKDVERAFLGASWRAYTRARRLKLAAILTLAVLTVASGTFAILAGNAQREANVRRAEAEKRRAEADARREDAQSLADFLLVDLATKLRAQGDLELLQGISEKALEYLRKRPTEALNAKETVNLSKAWLTTGEIMMIGGDADAATKQSFLPVDTMLRSAAHRFPTSDIVLNERGQTAFWIGYAQYQSHRYDQTRAHWTRYRDISAELTRRTPSDTEWWRQTAFALNNLGTLAMKIGDPASALAHFRKSESLKLSVWKVSGGKLQDQFDLADTRSWIGQAVRANGELKSAHDIHTASIHNLKKLLHTQPKASGWKSRLADFLYLDAELALARGEHHLAEQEIIESIAILERLHDKEDVQAEWTLDLAKGYLLGGRMSDALGDHATALRRLDTALQYAEILDPQDTPKDTPKDTSKDTSRTPQRTSIGSGPLRWSARHGQRCKTMSRAWTNRWRRSKRWTRPQRVTSRSPSPSLRRCISGPSGAWRMAIRPAPAGTACASSNSSMRGHRPAGISRSSYRTPWRTNCANGSASHIRPSPRPFRHRPTTSLRSSHASIRSVTRDPVSLQERVPARQTADHSM